MYQKARQFYSNRNVLYSNCLAFWNNWNLIFIVSFVVIIVVVLKVVSDVVIDAYDVLPSLTDSIAVIELTAQSIRQRLGNLVVNGFDDLQIFLNKIRLSIYVTFSYF